MSLIQLVNASRHHRMPHGLAPALDGVDLRIEAGEYVAVGGHSGSGKSSLLKLLAMLDGVTGGEYLWRGVRVPGAGETAQTPVRHGEIGYIAQRCQLLERYTVAQNIGVALDGSELDAAERRARIAALLQRFELQHLADCRPSQLSMGQQQCVAIGRAAIAQPALLLADEPTAQLDARQALQAMRLLGTLHAAGATVVLASHDAACTAHAARALQLEAGRVTADVQYRH
jgi:putative ABC transport system ATP-binding protein